MINISDKYYNLFNPPDGVDIFVLTGGRFSQKSFAVALAQVLWVVNFEHRTLFTRFTNASAKDSIIPEIEEKIEMLNYQKYFSNTNGRIESNFNKGKIVFKGMKVGANNQTANLKGVKDFSVWVLDEAEELTDYAIAEKTMLSIRGNPKGSKYPNIKIFIMNPTTKEHWIYKEYFEGRGVQPGFNGVKDNICYIHTSYLDCLEFVPDDILQAFKHLEKTNYKRYNHIVLGGWLEKAEGVIFDNWRLGKFDDSLEFIFGQDYGYFPDPTTLVKVAINEKLKYIYVKECFCKTNLSTKQIFDLTYQFTGFDKLVVADSAEKRLIKELKDLKINIQAALKGKGSLGAGIKAMQGYTIIVDPDSKNIVKELNNYTWNDRKSNIPNDAYNHCIDAIRYAFQRLRGKKKSKFSVHA